MIVQYKRPYNEIMVDADKAYCIFHLPNLIGEVKRFKQEYSSAELSYFKERIQEHAIRVTSEAWQIEEINKQLKEI